MPATVAVDTPTPPIDVPDVNLLNMIPADAFSAVDEITESLGLPGYRTEQIRTWLWERPVGSWSDASNLPAKLRADLDSRAPLAALELSQRQDSTDGTVKFLWKLNDGLAVESVWIPSGKRATLCISSQAGCAYGCVFCATGRMGFQRHLEPWEIVGQVRAAVMDKDFGMPTNIVFMGMGEPLHNWDGVDSALTILNDRHGMRIGARRITISTIGIIPNLRKFARRPEQFRLAISLHASTSARRAAIMPVEKKYPLDTLLKELEDFQKRITFEYVMIQGANDTPADADELATIAKQLGAMINLLPLHPGGAPGHTPTSAEGIEKFANRLKNRGAHVTIRRSRGLDIAAACGQLRIDTNAV